MAECKQTAVHEMRMRHDCCTELEAIRGTRPKIVCISGSSRFVDKMSVTAWEMEKKGILVVGLRLLPAWYKGIQAHHQAEAEGVREILDELHLRKIDLADELLIYNEGGYIGSSTKEEIEYAKRKRKPIRFLEKSPKA